MDGNGTLSEEFLHHRVVAFGDHFDELLVRFFGFVSERAGDLFDRGLAIAVRLVGVGLHGHQVDDAAKSFFRTNRQLQRDNIAAKDFR